MDIISDSIKSVEPASGDSDSDSLEYSNDDRENPLDQGINDKDKVKESVNKRPPVYPTLQNEICVMQTPKRGTHDTNKPNPWSPGPLNLFSPDLSPICHIDCNPQCQNNNRLSNSTDDKIDSDYRPDLNSSIDSLDMESEFFRPTDSEETGAEPCINLWRNRLFDLDHEDHSFHLNTVEKEQQQDGSMSLQSNNMSVDSDLNFMANSASVYPTTDAVYNNSVAASDMNTSIDSDKRITKQSLVFPTTMALNESSGEAEQLSTNLIMNNDIALVDEYSSIVDESDSCAERKQVTEDECCSDADIKKQSVLLSVEHGFTHNLDLSNISLLDASVGSVENYFTTEQDQTLQSLSLLPGSPLMMSVYGLNEREILTQRQRSPTGRYPRKIMGSSGARKPALRPGTTTSKQSKQQLSVSISDTEFVSLNARRRTADLAAQATLYARDTSDLQPSLREPFSIPTSTFATATSDTGSSSRLSCWPKHRIISQSSKPVASTLEPNQFKYIHQDDLTNDSSCIEFDSAQHGKSESSHSASNSELPVGALYTLIVDGQGNPIFVPVLANAQKTPARTPAISSNKTKNTLRADQHGSHYSCAPSQTLPRQNPNHINFSPSTHYSLAQEREDFNGNNIDLSRVLERALHNGSLSAAKLNERWQTVSETSTPTSLRSKDSTSIPATKKLSKSPFRVGLSSDGKEYLLPSVDYWKERLLMRDLTSALKAPKSRPPLLPSNDLPSYSPWQENALGGSISSDRDLAMSAVKQTLWF